MNFGIVGYRGGVLASPSFRRYFLSRTISIIGDAAVPTALTLSILGAGRPAAQLGIVLAAALVSRAVLIVPAGLVADRFAKRRLLVISSVACGIAQLATALILLWHLNLWLIVAIQACYGAGASVAYPTAFGYLPQCVQPESLNVANSVLSASAGAAYLAGPCVTAVCAYLGSAASALLVDAGTFFISAALLSGLPTSAPDGARPSDAAAALRDGWTALRQLPWLIRVTLVEGLVLLLVVAPFMVIGPGLVQHVARNGWVLMMLVFATGEIAGGLLAGRLRLRRPLMGAALSLLSLGLPPLLLGSGAGLPALCAAELLAGTGITTYGVLVNTTVQRSTSPEHLAKVGALSVAGSFALLPLGYMMSPVLADVIGAKTVLWAAAGWTVAGVAVLLSGPDLRRVDAVAVEGHSMRVTADPYAEASER